MQFSQKTLGSQNAIKQLYRQASTVIKNTPKDKNPGMTKSSDVPFNKFYNAFNSTGHIKNFGLERFKNSQAKSIIQKLMQTQYNRHAEEEQMLLMNELQNIQLGDSSQPIPLNSTQNKIFCEVINLITQINEIQQQTSAQTEQLQKLKLQLKKQGIQYPEIQQKRTDLKTLSLKRFTKEQLQAMFEQNQKLQKQIQQITKDLTNKKSQPNQQKILDNVSKTNKVLRKQLSAVRTQILNSGQIDEQEIQQLTYKVQTLRQQIYILQQKRRGKLSQRDQEFSFLKNQNERLRLKTVQLLKKNLHPQLSKRKQELIQALQMQEQNKRHCLQQMNELKQKYQILMNQSSSFKRESNSIPLNQYDDRLQVQSKVSPFRNTLTDYQSSYGYERQKNYNNDKENYLQNYEPQRNRNVSDNKTGGYYSKWDSKY